MIYYQKHQSQIGLKVELADLTWTLSFTINILGPVPIYDDCYNDVFISPIYYACCALVDGETKRPTPSPNVPPHYRLRSRCLLSLFAHLNDVRIK